VLGESISDWVEVKSGVPQGSVLGPTLFIAYVNDLPLRLNNKCKLYADDCKILASVESREDVQVLQGDIDAVVSWCNDWLMELNVTKCKVMHCGRKNLRAEYKIMDRKLAVTSRERDLGIILTPNMKWKEQVCNAASVANRVLSMLRNAFVSRDSNIWRRLYMTYVRPHLEFAVSAWNPHQRGDVKTLEKVQRRATRVPTSLKGVQYEDRCKSLELDNLTERRKRGDLIEMFKLTKRLEIINWANPPIIAGARGDKRAQYRREIVTNCNQRHNFFLNRVASQWNDLPKEVVEAGSVNEFKNKLDLLRTRAASKGAV